MKKYLLFLITLIFVGCDEDLPNQYTSVEGYVTDYNTQDSISGMAIIISENERLDFQNLNYKILNSLTSDSTGYYFFEFYNDSDRYYVIHSLTTAIYVSSAEIQIIEGKKNKIDIPVKAFIKMNLKCVNRSYRYNKIRVVNFAYQYKREDFNCDNGQDCEISFHIIPERNTYFQINLEHWNELDQIDKTLTTSLEFLSGKKDTTITYYY